MKMAFSSSELKIIAIVTMVIDHVGMLFFPQQIVLRVIGRFSFPIFAFLIAEGHRRTSNSRNYLFRLLAFALISQIPHSAFSYSVGYPITDLNIFFTLSAGLLALILLKKMPIYLSGPMVVLLCLVSEFLNFDYGAYGVLLVLASSVFLSGQRLAGILELILLAVLFVAKFLPDGFISIQIFALMAVPIVALYNGENGIALPRRLLYWFYPLHLLFLWGIWVLLY